MAEKHQETKALLFAQRNSMQETLSCMQIISETTGTHDGSRTHHLCLSQTVRLPLRYTGKWYLPSFFMARYQIGQRRTHTFIKRAAYPCS